MPSPCVTVVVPNYNHVRFLAQRLDSILNQTYQDFEVLYLDDASTDSSADMFAAYADDPRIRAVLNSENSGSPFVQWNRGVREARGEYVWIAEADDYADPRLLETLVAKLEAHPNAGIAYCQSLLVDEQNRPIHSASDWTQPLHPTRWQTDFINDGCDECGRFLVRNNTIPNASAVLFRKNVYLQTGGADETMRACGDWLLYTNILLVSDVAFSAETRNFFRQHPQSATRSADRNGLSIKEAYQVVNFIHDRVLIDPDTLRLSCEARMNDWHKVLLSGQSRIPWSRSLAIYRLARRVDARLPLRLIRFATLLMARALRQTRTATPTPSAASGRP